MDGFPKSMVIKFQINSNFHNNMIFKFDYECEYFNHDKGQHKGCKTRTKIDEYDSTFQIYAQHGRNIVMHPRTSQSLVSLYVPRIILTKVQGPKP